MKKNKKKLCIIGGGAAGISTLWALANYSDQYELYLFHDNTTLGGHSHTVPVTLTPEGGGQAVTYPVDMGVQYIAQLGYPNTNAMISAFFKDDVPLTPINDMKISSSFDVDGTTKIWGNWDDPDHQGSGSLFTPDAQAAAKRFVEAVKFWGSWEGLLTVGDLLNICEDLDKPFDSDFVEYLLTPYLFIMNGYGGDTYLDMTLQDLFPLVASLFPEVLGFDGPLLNFFNPGEGWQRFEKGTITWIEAMAKSAVDKGAIINASPGVYEGPFPPCLVQSVYPSTDGSGYVVDWTQMTFEEELQASDTFDEVVFAVAMPQCKDILNNTNNASNWAKQQPYIEAIANLTVKGACIVHHDESIITNYPNPEYQSLLHFTGEFSGTGAKKGKNATSDMDKLPYDLEKCYSTFMLNNIYDMPDDMPPTFLTMYGSAGVVNPPAKDKIVVEKNWVHGRWSSSFWTEAKENLYNIQGQIPGVGPTGLWFAGNNCTADSEEGALVSGLVIANKLDSSFDWLQILSNLETSGDSISKGDKAMAPVLYNRYAEDDVPKLKPNGV